MEKKKRKKDWHKRARRFTNIFRFIDDLIVLNDGGEFDGGNLPSRIGTSKGEWYEHVGSVLDLGIKIRNDRFYISLYDKRDDFSFYIVRMSYLCSNIPSKIFYSAFGAEIFENS